MTEIFGVPVQALFGQLMLGLVNGSFYAVLSLGLAVIFGMLNIINFAHGALYMAGAMLAWIGLEYLGIGYWWMLLLAPLCVGLVGIAHRAPDAAMAVQARPSLRPAADLRPGTDDRGPVPRPLRRRRPALFDSRGASGAFNLGFMFLPKYRAWVIVASLSVCLRPGT
jgi:branched-chain amino acid transport system permease protein